ncbi:MAG: hypothetical protein ACKVX7_08165 [Planctomycetota bacterium]
MRSMSCRPFLILLVGLSCSVPLWGQIGPDVIVGELMDTLSYGTDGSGIFAYAVGTISCNVGDEELDWIQSTPAHPVIGQSLYRLDGGRIVQLGQSWLKHGFQALQGGLCTPCTPSSMGGAALGVGCSDPYGAGYNGSQPGLGPKSQVNAATGVFPFPFAAPPYAPVIGRRIQVHAAEIDPSAFPAAQYFAEGHYVTYDDSAAGNAHNNASYRPVVIGSDAVRSLTLIGDTVREVPALFAWQANDPQVQIQTIDIPADGRIYVGYRVTDNGNGTWRYEYAIHNLNSHLSVQAFTLFMSAATVTTAVGFHDVDYHSGEPYAGADWLFARNASTAEWATETYAANPSANALRWGTLYNFWFDADSPPAPAAARLSTFRPGTPTLVYFPCVSPSDTGTPIVLPPTGLSCESLFHNVALTWTNGEVYDQVQIFRGAELAATLPGDAESFADLDVEPVGGYSYIVFGLVAGDSSPAAFCFAEVLGVIAPQNLQCEVNTSDVTLTWTNPNPQDYENLQIVRDGVAIADLGSAQLSFTDVGVPIGQHIYELIGLIDGHASPAATCGVLVFDGVLSGNVLLFAHPNGSGSEAISLALTNNDLQVTTVEILTAAEIAQYDACFVALGMYPNNHQLSAVEGQLLADYLQAGGRVYLEGGDAFAYDPPTAFHAVDGVTGLADGGDDLFWLVPQDSALGLDLTAFDDQPYTSENSWVDHLAPDGAQAGIIWRNSASSYDCGVFKAAALLGPTLCCSFLFEGIGDGSVHDAVMSAYLSALGINPADQPHFIRGDVNDDLVVNIADAISLLGWLFTSGPAPGCARAADANDSGGLDISDAIFTLSFLFAGGPPLPAPFPNCDADPSLDGLSCDVASCP